MKTVKIRLSSIEAVRNFVEIVRKFEGDIDLSSGRYIVDAKSSMGIFSLELMNPITLDAHSEDGDRLLESLKADHEDRDKHEIANEYVPSFGWDIFLFIPA